MDRLRNSVCSSCLASLPKRSQRGTRGSVSSIARRRKCTIAQPSASHRPGEQRHQAANNHHRSKHHKLVIRTIATSIKPKSDLDALSSRVQDLSAGVLKPINGPVPLEQTVLYTLEQLEAIARSLADAYSIAGAASISGEGRERSATSALLGSVNARRPQSPVSKASLLVLISQKAEQIIRHPNVFITPAILKTYVSVQVLLHQPGSLPDVFNLYANKPTPTAGSGGKVTYVKPNPRSMKAAIDQDTANLALSSAILAHDLSLAMAIIEMSFAAPAYPRAKIVRQCAIPGTGLAIAPLVAYGASSQYAAWSTMLDPAQATTMAFAGIMTYIAAVGGVGYVAITTANDQMDRVTWAPGIPLWERWVREQERAALDRVAGAWGFKSLEKRGDEEGEDWAILRETCGRKGMELDKVELMEGMQ